MSSAFSKTFSKVKESTSRLVSKNERTNSNEPIETRSSYMGPGAFTDHATDEQDIGNDYRAPNKGQKLASTLTRGLTSAKYATVRSAKGIKIGLQEGTDKVSGAISNTTSKLKKNKPESSGMSSNGRAVPVV